MNVRRRVWRCIWKFVLIAAVLGGLLPARQIAQAATYTVNSTDDVNDSTCSAVHCSLREAIIAANTNPGPDTIAFNIAGCGGVCIIQPLTALPVLTGGGTTIDGYTQPGAAPASGETPATIRIEIDGTNTTNQSGLYITSANNVVRGLAINRFDWDGIGIGLATATGNVIAGNHLGTDAGGTVDRGNGHSGVFVGLGATNNTIGGDEPAERNVLAGNEWSGVEIHGSDTMSNTVSGNYIGTRATGMAALGNALYGVRIYGGARNNTVGGDTAGERNVISANGNHGVVITGEGRGNVVAGNYIGTDAAGTADLGNTYNGVFITGKATGNTIGGTPGERNVISGNGDHGVSISGAGTVSNTVAWNYIGANAAGSAALGNATCGVYVGEGAQGSAIVRNFLSANLVGACLAGANTMYNAVAGNFIGGDVGLGNTSHGVGIVAGASNNLIGGDTAGARNVISGNGGDGVRLEGADTTANTVVGNYIGTDATGAGDWGNAQNGVGITSGAHDNVIGGDTAGERNVISGNDDDGIEIEGAAGNVVQGNYIGVVANGTAVLGNADFGMYIGGGAQNNTVGGTAPGEGNVIAASGRDGIYIADSSTAGNVIAGNYIGTDASGTMDWGNGQDGIELDFGTHGNTIGPGNVIAHNAFGGVLVDESTTIDNVITRNRIFANTGPGIELAEGAHGSIAAPVIASTTLGSVHVAGTACAGCTVEVFANSDSDGEGEFYLGSAVASGSGTFDLMIGIPPYPYLTATATDADLGTSEFSAVFTSTVRFVLLPLVVRE